MAHQAALAAFIFVMLLTPALAAYLIMARSWVAGVFALIMLGLWLPLVIHAAEIVAALR